MCTMDSERKFDAIVKYVSQQGRRSERKTFSLSDVYQAIEDIIGREPDTWEVFDFMNLATGRGFIQTTSINSGEGPYVIHPDPLMGDKTVSERFGSIWNEDTQSWEWE